MNRKETGAHVAQVAGKVLRAGTATDAEAVLLAASCLTQSHSLEPEEFASVARAADPLPVARHGRRR